MFKRFNSRGITFVEMMVVVGILIVLGSIALPAIYSFQKESDLNDNTREIINNLKLARAKTLASKGAASWGVYFATSTTPHQYTLFRGEDYASRTTSCDEIFKISRRAEFSEINLGVKEVVFNRITGETSQTGSISLRLKDNPTKFKTIYIENSGQVGLSTISPSDTDRLKDSRHVHFNYTRQISTSSEKLILNFEGGVTKEIVIADNLKGGQIYWQGEVEVEGEAQQLKVHSHRLNNPDTQFSVHRDRRYNSKALEIDIDGDPDYPLLSPTLISYGTNGTTTKGNSIYVSNPIWQ